MLKSFFILAAAAVLATTALGQLTLDKNFTAGVTDGDAAGYVSAVQADGKILVGGNFQFVRGVPRRSIARLNPNGSVDESFVSNVAGLSSLVYDIKVLPDDKILIAGSFNTYNGSPAGRIARLNPDGSLDTSFNSGGVGATGTISGITFQPDGKIILSGQMTSYNGVPKFTVIRINHDGSLDESFTSPFSSSSPFVEQTVVQTTGKIVIAGAFTVSGYRCIARLNSDGTLDTAFTPLTTDGSFFAVALDSNGNILVGGSFTQLNGMTRHGMVRLAPDGALDPAFNANFSQFTYVEWFQVKPDGDILVAGDFPVNDSLMLPVRQLNADGTLDPTFSAPVADYGGYHLLSLPSGQLIVTGLFVDVDPPGGGRQCIIKLEANGSVDNSFNAWLSLRGGVTGMFRQLDGKILVGGDFSRANGAPHRSLARFNSDGSVDQSFESGWGFYGSFYPTYLAQSTLAFLSFAQQNDGKIFMAAPYAIVFSYDLVPPRFGLSRISIDGSPDTSFTLPVFASQIHDVLVQPDGKILIAGSGMGSVGSPPAVRILTRINPDGTLDASFTQGTTAPSGAGYARRIIRQPDGKLIVTGTFTNYLSTTRNGVVRLNENGTVDTSFTGSTGGANFRLLGLQSDGKIVYAGVNIRRWNANGTADGAFTQGTDLNGLVTSMYIQPDDKIVIGGAFTTYNGQPANRLARLNPDGTLDTTVTSGLDSDPANMITSIIPTADGHILIGGVFSNYGGIPRNNIAKLRIDDPTGTMFDYDGDGRTDFSVFRPSTGAWYLQRSTAGFQGLQFGAAGDKLTPADYDGDGKTDIAVYRPSAGQWFVLNSATGTVTYPVFGVAEDVPAPGDYDGDGKADLAVFRPSQGTWYRQNSSNGSFFGMQFGATGDVPTVGDFDGDGRHDLGIFRPSIGDWYHIRSSNGSVFGERFGQTGDKIAPADYDGDGQTDIAIYRPSTGHWVIRNSATATYSYSVFGAPADIPVAGDYDGDGRADIGVWRPSDGTWYIKRSDNGQFIVFQWGQNGDRPTPSAFGN